jgi:hypothetical protein
MLLAGAPPSFVQWLPTQPLLTYVGILTGEDVEVSSTSRHLLGKIERCHRAHRPILPVAFHCK